METNSGFVILKSEQFYHSDAWDVQKFVVLGYRPTVPTCEWVTWEKSIMGNAVSYYWGHYFADEAAANADYHRRLAEKYENK